MDAAPATADRTFHRGAIRDNDNLDCTELAGVTFLCMLVERAAFHPQVLSGSPCGLPIPTVQIQCETDNQVTWLPPRSAFPMEKRGIYTNVS